MKKGQAESTTRQIEEYHAAQAMMKGVLLADAGKYYLSGSCSDRAALNETQITGLFEVMIARFHEGLEAAIAEKEKELEATDEAIDAIRDRISGGEGADDDDAKLSRLLAFSDVLQSSIAVIARMRREGFTM